jgi:HD-GYP domain-containing protein (c-di-GMP phosphodiesterase class II)
MSEKPVKIRLIYVVTATLLLVGLVPVLITGWMLSERSGSELRAVENRYQIQLVQEKARHLEMFGQRYTGLVKGIASSMQLSGGDQRSTERVERMLAATLSENDAVLGLYIKPAGSEPYSVFRHGTVTNEELRISALDALDTIGTRELFVGHPRGVAGGSAIAIAAHVTVEDRTAATVVALVSLSDIARSVVGRTEVREADLWAAGLPIIMVVDQDGKAVFHPDASVAAEKLTQDKLKIVREWQESNRQIQSALVPFAAEFAGQHYEMIGAYSTARFSPGTSFGVITMQDERKALASVGEMRSQTWMISLGLAAAALLIGLFAARSLTSPLLSLASAARRIAQGDLSTRVETRNVTEIGMLGESFNTMSDKLEEYIADLAKAAAENRELFVGTVKALAAAIDGKDKYTRGHSERVARISVGIGRQLGLSDAELETLRISALLHDIGKIAIDDAILKKPAALTDEEFEVMKTHPQKGFKIMSQIPAMKEFLPGMYMHHEMVNGQGYPQGLRGDQIPLQAKIVSVADTFDAMTIDRPYQKGMLLPDALERIRSFVGTRYDARVVEALIRGCEAGEIANGVVRLMANIAIEKEPVEEPVLAL